MRTRTLTLALALALPLSGSAQFDFGGGLRGGGGQSESSPWASLKLNAKTTVKLDFRNANIDMILQFYQRASGVTIVKDPGLTGALTVTSAKNVTLDEAFKILNTTLGLKNYEMRRDGTLLVIRPREQRREERGGFGGMDMSAMMNMFQGNQPQLKVYPITNANATQMARIINEVFATVQDPMQQLMQMFGAGQPQFGGFQPGGNRGGGNNNRFGGMQGRGGFGGFGGFAGRPGGQGGVVRASADDFSNSVIVNAPTREQGQVQELIKQIDKPAEAPQTTKVYALEFAAANEVTPVIQNVLTSNAPTGRGGIGSQNIPIEQRFQQAFRLGSAQASFGTVVADVRTNSVVVTATEENHKLVAEVVKELDKEVKYEASTFVFPLANARADQMSQLLQQAFGTRQGINNRGNFGTGFNRTNQNNNNRNRNNNPFRGGGGNQLRGQVVDDGRNLELELEQAEADAGELFTMVGVAQGGGFGGFFGGGQQNRQNAQTTGRSQDGRLVNVRDLTGQVTVIPDQNTNSLVVVTTPENADLIRSILEQLDKIPEQVMIETIIVEATLDSSTKLGVEWSFAQNKVFGDPAKSGNANTNFGLQNAQSPAEGFRYTLTGGDLSGFLNALKSDRKFQVLSTPRIFTSNNVEAQINISQSVPYVLSTREDQNGNLTFNYAFQDVGIVLTVTPRITSNGYVTMDVSQTANDLQGFTDFNAPIVNQRQADTTVSVKDGETIILGGIIRSTVSSTVKKVPLLGDIPLLGQLFRSNDKNNVKTELLVFLTPRLVKNDADAKALRDKGVEGLSDETKKLLEDWWKAKQEEEAAKAAPKKEPNDVPAPKPRTGGNQP